MRRRVRVPVMLQTSATDCGAAAMAIVLSAHGRRTTVREARAALGVGRDGSNARQMAEYGRAQGLEVVAFSLDLDGLAGLRLPAVIHWHFQHYLVLERWNGRTAKVVDPSSGRRTIDRAELSRGFTGVALQFVPGPGFQRRRGGATHDGWRFARGLLSTAPRLLARVLVASLVLQLLLIIPPLVTAFMVDTVIGFGQADLLTGLAVGLVALVVAQAVGTYARGALLNHLQAQLDASTMRRFFAHLFSLPYSFFQNRPSGDLIMRLSSNALIREVITGQTLSLFIDGSFVLVYATLLLAVAPIYGGLVLALGALQFAVVAVTFRAMRELTERDVAAQAAAQSYAIEALNAAETVKASGTERQVFDRWSVLFDSQLGASVRRRRLDAVNESFMTALRFGAPLTLLCIGTAQVVGGERSLGTMLALNALAATLLTPLSSLANSVRQFQTVGTHLERLTDVLQERAEQDENGGPGAAHRLRGRVELRSVGFRYGPTGPWALRDVTLDVPVGAKVALVGRTGSGKSTLAKMMLGLYRPARGEINFDGVALDGLDLRTLRRQCGVVTQDAALFSGSVRDNISLGRPDLPFERVVQGARLAQIHDEVIAMPMGYETFLPEGGTGLSGGQRQRLALARALAAQPALLVLDEATSHLDAVTEQRVDQVLSDLACTRVVIAHRLSTVRNADLIVVLDGGRVVEVGTHDHLMACEGHYTELIHQQVERSPLAAE
ncbi:peptidase domain-containing ABC transporter [Asanoa sp. NPDC049518]|uniref:peptidase domain-containing ABC transporter n=1 Tax=unclassified Asanoa TaxID=2685164 RepID=UPI00343FD505